MKAYDTIEDRIAVLNNDRLLKLCHDLANRISYFNSANSRAYVREAKDRELTKHNFWKVHDALTKRGVAFDSRGYML